MDFISLGIVVTDMASHIRIPPGHTIIGSAEFQATWPASEAAKKLFQRLHNEAAGRPQWVEQDTSIGLPLVNDAVSGEAMELLRYAAQWFKRESYRQLKHWIHCQENDIPKLEQPLSIEQEGQWGDIAQYLRAFQIGFDRHELVQFLNTTGIRHCIVGGLPATRASGSEGAASADGDPVPLDTGDIAKAFARVHFRDEKRWRTALGDERNEWLLPARVKKGRAGKPPHTWNPVRLAELLLEKKKATSEQLDTVFKHEALRAWLNRWEKFQKNRPPVRQDRSHKGAGWILA